MGDKPNYPVVTPYPKHFWHDAFGCHWCHRETESMISGHDGMCPVPVVAQLEAKVGTCSICGRGPAVLVDRKHKGTYWLCGDCMGEKIEDKMRLEAENERLRPLAEYGLGAYQNIRLIFLDDALDVIKRVEALRGE